VTLRLTKDEKRSLSLGLSEGNVHSCVRLLYAEVQNLHNQIHQSIEP
jgi:hypothetical protein